MTRPSSLRAALPPGAALGCLLLSAPAAAQGPVGLTTGFERVESISHVRATTTAAGAEETAGSWRAGMGTNGGNGYSVPRVSLEYSWESGLSVGVAIGFMFSWSEQLGPDASVLEPRVGYALQLAEGLLLWPRLGLTLHDTSGPDTTHTALSLDAPLMLHEGGSFGSLSFGPYVDVGLGGGAGEADQTLHELGLAIGFQLF